VSASAAALAEAKDKTLLVHLRAGSEDGVSPDAGAPRHATPMYREMDIRFRLAKADGDLRELG